MIVTRKNIPIVISYLIVAALFIFSLDNGFFWDTIQLGSKHASHYFTTSFSKLLLPDSIDSGHIPAFGMYLALLWKIFGRELLVSHLAMLPFVFGILWQLSRLVKKFIVSEYAGWALLLILLDPTLLSQLSLISPDVPLVFFLLMGLNSILENSKKSLSLSVAFLFLISLRGMMVAFCLLIIDTVINISFSASFKEQARSLLKRSLVYLPALIIFIAFSTLHYYRKGWIGFHEDSPWAELFERVGFKGMIYNAGILGWRIIDFGRIGIWFVFFALLIRFRRDVLKTSQSKVLLLIFLVMLIFLSANMIWAENLLGHRYLLPVYLSFSLLCANILFSQQLNARLRTALMTLWIVSLTTGNLWVYPDKISQGWDSTLAHLPYYKLRKQAIEYLDEQKIDFGEVQSFFPNNALIDDIDLNNDGRKFADFNDCCDYVIYSNLFNVNDENYSLVKGKYEVIKQFRSGFLHMDVCRKLELP